MPIFYTDNPVLVTGSVATNQGSIVTASIPGPVTVTASSANPVWVTGTITSTGGGAVTQGGAWATLVSGTVGVSQSGGWTVQVSGSPSSLVWVTGAVASPVYVGQTASWLVGTGTFPSNITVNTGTMPVVSVTAALANPVSVNTGTFPSNITVNTGTFPVVTVSQSNIPVGTVTVTSAFASPVWVNTTGTITVSTGVFPTITVASHAVTQGGAWTALVSGAVGVLQSGALTVQVSGAVASGSQAAIGNPVVIAGVDSTNTVRTLSTTPAGVLWVSSSVAAPVFVTFTGTIPTGTFPVVSVTQGGAWTTQVSGSPSSMVWVTSTFATPVWVNTTGTITVSTGTFPVVSVTQGGALTTQVSGSVTASLDKAGNATLTTIEVGNTVTVLLASNANRKGATIFSVDNPVFIGFGQTPTITLFAAKVPSSSYYEIPYNWTGAVNAIAAVSGQTVNVQEFSA